MPDWFPRSLADAAVLVPLRILLLVVLALLGRWALHRLVRRWVQRATAQAPQPRSKPAEILVEAATIPFQRRSQRISALGSLMRSAITAVIMVATGVTVLAELGFNVNTIIAGTSIIGVTLAFGLQNVIKDLMAGVLMLVEDQLGVGDWVDLDFAAGTVEGISLRVTQLRDKHGVMWYVRNGEVIRVGNFSQGGPNGPLPEEVAEPSPAP